MSRFRDFDAAMQERAAEPLSFTLGGHLFEAPGFVPAESMLLLARVADLTGAPAVGAFGAFLESVLPPDQHVALHDAMRLVDFAMLLEVVRWIIEETTGRPLESVNGSALSPSPNGGSSSGISWDAGNHST